MSIGWGWKIALLYSCFVGLILTLVVASSRQKFDLVSVDYYKQELAYQGVLDAARNQSGLSAPVSIQANENNVIIDFPGEFKDKIISGEVRFYSAVNAQWDQTVKIQTDNNRQIIDRTILRNTQYTIKIRCSVDGKNYYQESAIQLHN